MPVRPFVTRSAIALAIATLSLAGLAIGAPRHESAGDPERGYRNLITRPYGGPMLTLAQYDKLWTVWEPKWKARVNASDPMSARRVALERYGFAPMPGPAGKKLLPVQFVQQGDQLVPTCMLCHAGRVPGSGKLLIGLPNTEIDMPTFLDDLAKLNGAPGMGSVFGTTRGRTNATFFSHALLMMRNEDLSLRKTMAPLGFPQFIDEDAPAWWNLGKKKSIYVEGLGQGDFHRAIMQFAMQGNLDGDVVKGYEPDFVDILAYIESVKPPKYPWPIDSAKAEEGRRVFDRACAQCHGVYGANASYPDRVVPIETIKTDEARLNSVTPAFRTYLAASWFGTLTSARNVPRGYQAPPLYGVWATAPYLHNGSVPTLYGVLSASARPKIFRRVGGYQAYDKVNVGWKVETLDKPAPPDLPGIERRRIVNTDKHSLHNTGHTFGFSLSERQKRAVVEYLKTL